MTENLLLEYTNGMRDAELGWGRLTRENLFEVLELHTLYADLTRRTPYLARARGSNLLAHIVRSLEQAQTGRPVRGALGRPGDALLVLSGHDTNLSNVSGMLGLAWKADGYQPDDVPPSSALVFTLWHDRGGDFVKLEFVAASPDQIRNLEALTLDAPPSRQEVAVPGCGAQSEGRGCAWSEMKTVLGKAIDSRFTELRD
jgi:4-phytase/acid phosphatase